jgi:hypothetical protein
MCHTIPLVVMNIHLHSLKCIVFYGGYGKANMLHQPSPKSTLAMGDNYLYKFSVSIVCMLMNRPDVTIKAGIALV